MVQFYDSSIEHVKVAVLNRPDLRPNGSSCPEWAILDIQGDLETRHDVPLSGKFIGDLHFTYTDIPILLIGHHILYGKVIELEKPLAVLIKNSTADSAVEAGQRKTTHYIIQAVIKKKLTFRTRPKPIIASVPKKL